MLMINIIKVVCLSIIILINFGYSDRRRSRPLPERYKAEQYSKARQLRPRIIDNTDGQPGEESRPVPPPYEYDDYRNYGRQSRPRPNWYEAESYLMARQPRSRYIDDTIDQPEEEIWQVPITNDEYQHYIGQSRPRAYGSGDQPYLKARLGFEPRIIGEENARKDDAPWQVALTNEYDDYQHYKSQIRPRNYGNKVQSYSTARQEPQPRIIGGENAQKYDAPWQVVLYNNDDGFVCSGALIAPNAIITAGHCIKVKVQTNIAYQEPNNGITTYVAYGSTMRDMMPHKLEVVEYYMTPNFIDRYISEPPGDFDDIAILRLNDSVVESDTVKIIKFTDEYPQLQTCQKAQVTGWGRCYNENNILPVDLKITWMRMISRNRCKLAYPHLNLVGRNFTCGRCDYSTTCQGDSGSPVVIDGKLVGVLAGGVTIRKPGSDVLECVVGAPNYITSTKKMWPWIKRTLVEIKQNEKPVNHNIRDPSDLRRRSLNYNNMNAIPPKSIPSYMLGRSQQLVSKIRTRTVGGPGVTNSPQNRANWQISLVTSHSKTHLDIKMKHFCGGALIAKNLAITAAHCIFKWDAYLDPLWIRYNGLHVDSLSYATRVLRWFWPDNAEPDCPRGVFDIDIVLLVLEDDVYETENVKFIALKDKPLVKDELGTITGWGTHQAEDISQRAGYLQMALVHFIGREECLKSTRPQIGVKENCGRIFPASVCISDDGGPLIIYEDNRWKLAGVLSTSKKGCEHEEHDAVFVEMTEVIDWILNMVRKEFLTMPEIA